MIEVMLDMETWGVQPGCALRSIGACTFNQDTMRTGMQFNANITLQSCLNVGLKQDPKTVDWWARQDPSVSEVLNHDQYYLPSVLKNFAQYLQSCGEEIIMWSNGAPADIVWLEAAYTACGMAKPWKFYNERCYRTIKSLYHDVEIPNYGLPHVAVDDAIRQAMHLMRIRNEYHIPFGL